MSLAGLDTLTAGNLWENDMSSQTFVKTIERMPKGKARVPVPFDPNEVWGSRREHHVGGVIDGFGVRGSVVT